MQHVMIHFESHGKHLPGFAPFLLCVTMGGRWLQLSDVSKTPGRHAPAACLKYQGNHGVRQVGAAQAALQTTRPQSAQPHGSPNTTHHNNKSAQTNLLANTEHSIRYVCKRGLTPSSHAHVTSRLPWSADRKGVSQALRRCHKHWSFLGIWKSALSFYSRCSRFVTMLRPDRSWKPPKGGKQ